MQLSMKHQYSLVSSTLSDKIKHQKIVALHILCFAKSQFFVRLQQLRRCILNHKPQRYKNTK